MGGMQGPRAPDDVRVFFTTWIDSNNNGDWDSVAQLLHPDVVLVDPMTPQPARGRAAGVARARAQYAPFPDGRIETIGSAFVSLDEPELSYRWRFVGTHLRPVRPPGFAATGRRVAIEGTSVLRFRDHLVVDVRVFFDATDAARQMLAAPRAGSPLERVVVLSQRLRAKTRRRVGR